MTATTTTLYEHIIQDLNETLTNMTGRIATACLSIRIEAIVILWSGAQPETL